MKNWLPVSFVFALAACGGGASSVGGGGGSETADKKDTNKTNTVQMSGAVVDGYIRQARVCLDLTEDYACSPAFEPTTVTDDRGHYELAFTDEDMAHPKFKTANLVVVGGEDIDTGKPFFATLVSPRQLATESSTETDSEIQTEIDFNVSVLTTLVEQSGDEEKIKEVLGFSGESVSLGVDLIDFMKNGGDPEVAKKLYAQNIALIRGLETMSAAAIKERVTSSTNIATRRVVAALINTLEMAEYTNNDVERVSGWIRQVSTEANTVGSKTLANASKLAAVTSETTAGIVLNKDDLTSEKDIQQAAMETDYVVWAVNRKLKSTNLAEVTETEVTSFETEAEDAADSNVAKLAHRYLVNQGVDLSQISSTTIDSFKEDTGLSTLTEYTLATIKAAIESTYPEIATAIQKRIDFLAAQVKLIAFLKANDIKTTSMTEEDKARMLLVDATELAEPFTVQPVFELEGIPFSVKSQLFDLLPTSAQQAYQQEVNKIKNEVTSVEKIDIDLDLSPKPSQPDDPNLVCKSKEGEDIATDEEYCSLAVQYSEGDTFEFIVILKNAQSYDVELYLEPRTNVEGNADINDFTADSSAVVIRKGDTEGRFSVSLLEDGETEQDEYFFIVLSKIVIKTDLGEVEKSLSQIFKVIIAGQE